MITELIDHAERVLRHAPGHSMSAGSLHRTVAREAGIRIPLSHFLAELRARPERFTVLAPLPLDDAAAWRADESAAYADALRSALAATGPFITLVGGHAAGGATMRPARAAPQPAYGPGPAGALNEGVAELLRAVGDDEMLRRSVSSALAEIQAAYPAIREAPAVPVRGRRGGAARSTTAPPRPRPRR